MKEDRKRLTLAGTRAYARWSPVALAWYVLLGEDITTARLLGIRDTREEALDQLNDYVTNGWYPDILSASEKGR